jgi:hypothetical protein
MKRRFGGPSVSILVVLACTGCASISEPTSEYREEKIYRTGSNLPVKDYGGANVEQRGPEIINPINRPLAPVMNRKPAG